MSGFGGGGNIGSTLNDLLRQVQQQSGPGKPGMMDQTQPIPAAPSAPMASGELPGEPQGGYAQYGQQGAYNALTQDMSRGFQGGFGFSPQFQPPGMNPMMQGGRGAGGFGGRYGAPMGYGQGFFNYSPFGNPYESATPPPPSRSPSFQPLPSPRGNWLGGGGFGGFGGGGGSSRHQWQQPMR